MSDKVVRKVEYKNSSNPHYSFFCPGCRCGHVFETPKWTFNNDFYKPTIRASILIHENKENRKSSNDRYGHQCHSFVTDGMIQFLGDCTHNFKGQTVKLEPF